MSSMTRERRAARHTLVFVMLLAPLLGQAPPEPTFVSLAEGYTSADPAAGMTGGYRMFTTPSLPGACAATAPPATLEVATSPILRAGEWFAYDELVVLARDGAGALLRPVPIRLATNDERLSTDD